MKENLLQAIVALSLCMTAPAQSLPALSSAVGWWAGDGDVTDRLGNHTGAFVGAVKYAPGIVGNAFEFDGVSSHVEIPDAPDLDFAGQMTVEAWIKPYGHVGSYDPVVKHSDLNQANGFAFEFSGNTLLFWVFAGGWRAAVGSQIPNNQWSHVAGTFDGQTIRVYVNGQLAGSAGSPQPISPASRPLMIGADPSNPSRHFYGLIDEPAVYNKALSADEIHSIYLAGSTGKGNSFRFTTPDVIVAQTNAPLSFALQATGGRPPYSWSLSESRLPNGVTLTTSGILQGTPTETGEFRFGVSVRDSTNATAGGYATIRIPIPEIPYPAPSDIVAWWPFEDAPASATLADRIGNNTAAKANGPTNTPGKVGQALHFNGVDQYLSVQNSAAFQFGTNDFSFETWARFDAPGGGSMGEPSHILIGSSDGPGFVNKWFFALGGGVLEFLISDVAVGVSFQSLGSFSPTVGQWYHLAVVKERNTLRCYVNGNTNGFATNVINIPITTAPVTIGQSEFIGLFNGAIDEPTVYRRALRAEEVKAIYNAGTAGKTVDLSIKPSRGGVGGLVTVHITGIGFKQGATVQLAKSGETNIVASQVSVETNGTSVEAMFDLHGKVLGSWDVVITNPDTNTVSSPGGFVVEQRQAPDLWADIAGLGLIRPGRPQQFDLFFGNQGNVDSGGGIIWISGIPTNVAVEVRPQLPAVAPPDPRLNTNQIPSTVFDLNGERVIMLMLKRVGPDSPSAVSFSLNTPVSQSINLNTWMYTDTDYEPPTQAANAVDCTCLCCADPADQDALREALDHAWSNWPRDNNYSSIFLPGGGGAECIGAAANLFADLAQAGQQPGSKLSGWGLQTVNGGTKVYPNGRREHNSTMLTSPTTGDRWLVDNSAFPQICKMIPIGPNKWTTTTCDWAKSGYEWVPDDGGPALPCRLPQKQKPHPINPVNSFDPNDQIGPEGVGGLRYLSGREPLHYVIRFENHDTATAPAQEVLVKNILDPYKVDINSVQLGDIHVGTNLISVPPGVHSFSTVFDLRTNQNLLVAIDCNLDPNTSTLTWHFRSLDPLTLQYPDDPLAGFLPPNITPPEGEGSVSFSVSARDSIATGTIVTNFASITFDYNAPIDTPVWTNAFDFTVPTIQVQPVEPFQVNDKFELKWGSTDTGSGVDRIRVELSTNGSPFTTSLETTSIVSTVIAGSVNSTYAMRVTVWDLVGHSNQTVVASDSSLLSTKFVSLGTNYMTWARQHFGFAADDLSQESTLWGLAANPSGVGSPNFFKWYYNQSPFSADSVSNRAAVYLQNRSPFFSMVRRKNEPGALLDVLFTLDIAQPWSVLSIPPQAMTNQIDETFEKVAWPCSLQTTNQGFYRLRISLNPAE